MVVLVCWVSLVSWFRLWLGLVWLMVFLWLLVFGLFVGLFVVGGVGSMGRESEINKVCNTQPISGSLTGSMLFFLPSKSSASLALSLLQNTDFEPTSSYSLVWSRIVKSDLMSALLLLGVGTTLLGCTKVVIWGTALGGLVWSGLGLRKVSSIVWVRCGCLVRFSVLGLQYGLLGVVSGLYAFCFSLLCKIVLPFLVGFSVVVCERNPLSRVVRLSG